MSDIFRKIKTMFPHSHKHPNRLRWFILLLLVVIGGFYIWQSSFISKDSPIKVIGDAEVALFKIASNGPVSSSYDPAANMGKGMYANFLIYAPAEDDLIIDTIRIRKQGASDSEIPNAWLRLNNIRSYVKSIFRDSTAIFHVFPVADPPEGTFNKFTNKQGTDKLILTGAPSSFTIPKNKRTSVQLYGEYGERIFPRQQETGINFCIEEIKGKLSSSGREAMADLDEPFCFNKMGIIAE